MRTSWRAYFLRDLSKFLAHSQIPVALQAHSHRHFAWAENLLLAARAGSSIFVLSLRTTLPPRSHLIARLAYSIDPWKSLLLTNWAHPADLLPASLARWSFPLDSFRGTSYLKWVWPTVASLLWVRCESVCQSVIILVDCVQDLLSLKSLLVLIIWRLIVHSFSEVVVELLYLLTKGTFWEVDFLSWHLIL